MAGKEIQGSLRKQLTALFMNRAYPTSAPTHASIIELLTRHTNLPTDSVVSLVDYCLLRQDDVLTRLKEAPNLEPNTKRAMLASLIVLLKMMKAPDHVIKTYGKECEAFAVPYMDRVSEGKMSAAQLKATVPWPAVLEASKAAPPNSPQAVALALYTLFPPRRASEWREARVIKCYHEEWDPLYHDCVYDAKEKKGVTNMVWVPPGAGPAYVWFGKFKNVRAHGANRFEIGTELASILRRWIYRDGATVTLRNGETRAVPTSNWLFPQQRNPAACVAPRQFSKLLLLCFEKTPYRPNYDALRHSWINHMKTTEAWKDPQQRQMFAKMMAQSLRMQLAYVQGDSKQGKRANQEEDNDDAVSEETLDGGGPAGSDSEGGK